MTPKGLPTETDLFPIWEGTWELSDGGVLQQGEEGLFLGDQLRAREPIDPPVIASEGDRVVFARRDPGQEGLFALSEDEGFSWTVMQSSAGGLGVGAAAVEGLP